MGLYLNMRDGRQKQMNAAQPKGVQVVTLAADQFFALR